MPTVVFKKFANTQGSSIRFVQEGAEYRAKNNPIPHNLFIKTFLLLRYSQNFKFSFLTKDHCLPFQLANYILHILRRYPYAPMDFKLQTVQLHSSNYTPRNLQLCNYSRSARHRYRKQARS